MRYRALPGGDLIEAGLRDLRNGDFSAEALLVAIGAPRLRSAGLTLPTAADEPVHPELALYERLCRDGGDAFSRYNAYIRRLVSFERALDLLDQRPRGSAR